MIPPRMRPSTHGASLRFVCAGPAKEERGLPELLHSLMQWCTQVAGLEGAWSALQRESGTVIACASAAEVAAALELSRTAANRVAPAGGPSCAYRTFYLGPLYRYHASLRLELWQGADGSANRTELVVHPAIDVSTARQILLAMVGFIKPTWAAVGPDERPPRTFDVRRPAVGWLMYLSSAYPSPQGLPASVEVSSMKSLGLLLQASPQRFDPRDAVQLETLAAIERALGESAS